MPKRPSQGTLEQPTFNSTDTADSIKPILSSRWGQSKRPLITAVAVTVIVLALVITAAILLKDKVDAPMQKKKSYKLEDIVNGKFKPKVFNGTWVSDTDFLYVDEKQNAVLQNVYFHQNTIIARKPDIPLDEDLEYQLSPDKKFLLVVHNKSVVPTDHSVLAQYEVISRTEHKIYSLVSNKDSHSNLLQYATWIPGTNGIVFVYQNNIYFRPTAGTQSVEYKVTDTGIPGLIYNGLPDFIYKESDFTPDVALWFSPDGTKLAYATFNDSSVEIMPILHYGTTFDDLNYDVNQYPRNVSIRYPKVGTQLPNVTLNIIDLEGLIHRKWNKVTVPLPENLKNSEPILCDAKWVNNEEVVSVWISRNQTNGRIFMYNFRTKRFREELPLVEEYGWLTTRNVPIYSDNGTSRIQILPVKQGYDVNTYPHIVLTEMDESRPITTGHYTVTKIIAWDEKNHMIYYLASSEDNPTIQHLYRIADSKGVSSMSFRQSNYPLCITCDISRVYGDSSCLYNTAVFNPSNTYFTLICGGPDVPEISLYDARDITQVYIWEGNLKARKYLGRVQGKPTTEMFQVSIGNKYWAQVKLYLPPDLNPERKYPLLVHIHGDPGKAFVTYEYNVDWDMYMSGHRDFIVATIDGRGSALKGNKMMFEVWRNLGQKEIQDQLYVTRFLLQKFKYIDADRIAVWGSNYGGYGSAMALIQDRNNLFKCGISVTPIVDWMYESALYAEQFMGQPHMNHDSYRAASLLNKVENLRDKKFLLIHGTHDTVVHSQHSLMLAKALTKHGILFRHQSYTDEENGLLGVQIHLYKTMENFLDECFK